MLQELGYIFELLGTIAGFLMAFYVLRQNKKYIGNQLMAASTIFISFYIGSIFIYDVVATELAVQIFYRIALISIMLGASFMYFTMQVMVHSSSWLRKRYNYIVPILIIIGFAIYLILTDFITIINLDMVDTQIDLIPLATVSLWVLVFLIASIVDLYLHGLRHAKGKTKKNMTIFMAGLLINLLAIVFTIIANLITNPEVGTLLDVLFFLTLAIGMGVMTFGFVKKRKNAPQM